MEDLQKSQVLSADNGSLELLSDIDNGRNKNKFDFPDDNIVINKSEEEANPYHGHFIHDDTFDPEDQNLYANEQQENFLLNDEDETKEILESILEAEEEKEEDVDDKKKLAIKESDESIELIKKDSIPDKMIVSKLSKLDERITTIGRLKELTEERRMLRMKNGFLQKKCLEWIQKTKKYDELEKTIESGSIHNDDSYEQVLEEYMRIKVDVENKRPTYEIEIGKMEKAYKIRVDVFEKRFNELLSREMEIGNNVLNYKTGVPYGEREVNRLIRRQKLRATELADTRFIYLKRRNCLNDLLLKLYEVDNLGIGYTTMEYEQMSVQRQTLHEKVDDREEEIGKIREKCFTYVAVLSHINESIDSVNQDIEEDSLESLKYSEIQSRGRYVTMKRKLERDIARKRNIQLRESSGLLAHPDLLGKMETDILQLQYLKEKIEWLETEVYLQHRKADTMKAFLKKHRDHLRNSLDSEIE